MPQTEYKGSKYLALLEEFRDLGVGGLFFRVRYEFSKKLGFIERKHAPRELSAEEVIESLDLKNPSLAQVHSAYNSHGTDGAVPELIRHFKSRQSPGFFFNWRDRELYQRLLREHFADQESQLLEQADRICRHEFEVFGSKSIQYGDQINWHFDPSTGSDWPLTHWSKIDIAGSDRIGDVKFTWEVNRHQFFFTLGRAYWFTGDEKYARKFAELMRSWINTNPPEIGVNWYSNLEIAIRLICWIWAYHYFLDSPFFDDQLHFDFLRIVLQSCRHLTRDFAYSLRSMKNNHIIGDAAGLAFAGILFPEFRESERWRKTYINILYRELKKQVYDDGADFEQSISYHKFVLYFYLLLFRIMQINGHDFPAELVQKLEKMIEFTMYTMKPDRRLPGIGDNDDAGVLFLSNESIHDATPTLSTGAVLFQRGDFKQLAGRLSEETLWLNGEESIQIFSSLEESPPSDLSRGFPDGGYYAMRTAWDADARYLLFKCGPHADHGHADALHVELYCNSENYLRDSGTYAYNGPWEWRTFFRSTRAHNTVVVDGESQSIPHRVFRWLKPAKCKTNSWIASRNFDYVDAEHYGYSRYKYPVTHKRGVFFVKPEYWVIVDQLMGYGEHSVELPFHLSSGAYEISANIFRAKSFAIIPVISDDLYMDIYKGTEDPIRGWFSPSYGVKQPSPAVVYSFTGGLPKVMVTILDAGCSILDTGYSFFGNGNLAINAKVGNFEDALIFNWAATSPDSLRIVDTDAEIAYIRRVKAGGKVVRLALIAGSYIRLAGELLLETESPVRSLDLKVSSDGNVEIETNPEVNYRINC